MTNSENPETGPAPGGLNSPRAPVSRRGGGRRRKRFGLDVGDVIGNTFAVWFANFLPFSLLALILYSPYLIGGYVLLSGRFSLSDVENFDNFFTLANFFFFSNLLAGTVTYGVVMHLRGRRAPMGRCLTVGLSRILFILAVGILVYLAIGIWFVPAWLTLGIGPGVFTVLFLIGLVIATIVFTMFLVSVPAVVVEQVGPIKAMSRSAVLTNGSRLKIFGILLLFGLILFLMGLVVGLFVGIFARDLDFKLQFLFGGILEVLLKPLLAIVPAVIYQELRTQKEGVDIEDLAAVFD